MTCSSSAPPRRSGSIWISRIVAQPKLFPARREAAPGMVEVCSPYRLVLPCTGSRGLVEISACAMLEADNVTRGDMGQRCTGSPHRSPRGHRLMFLMYVDESGDPGAPETPGTTPFFVLTGLVVHEVHWHECLNSLVEFRRWCRARYGLKLREEIHAARMFNRPAELVRIRRHERLAIIHAYARRLAGIPTLNIVNVVVRKEDKSAGYRVLENAWEALIQRFENTITCRNFAGSTNPDDRGMLIPDHSSDERVLQLLRRMRYYNPVPHQPEFGPGYRNLVLERVAEDPSFRDSRHSYFIQSCDLAGFLLYQRLAQNSYIRKKGAKTYFNILDPILCRAASRSDPQGIVYL